MFVQPINVLKVQQELKEYQKRYLAFNSSPAREEFQNIINHILLHSGDGSGLYESFKSDPTIEDYLYERFIEPLREAKGRSSEGEYAEADPDLVAGILKQGTSDSLKWIKFISVIGKIRSSIKKEKEASMEILDQYIALYNKKSELARLQGREDPDLDIPEYK